MTVCNASGTKLFTSRKAVAGVPHPIPYQGSKRQLATLIVRHLPPRGRLVEPFAGSAAVTLAAAHLGRTSEFALNDAHKPLVDLWRAIVERPEEVADGYRRLWNEQAADPRSFYDNARARFNRTHQPDDFLYLLARCVKAAIRYNSRGEFNNSPDKRRLGARPDTMARHVRGASALLRGRTTFSAVDYRVVLRDAGPSDVVYMDPPYQGVCHTRDHRYATPISRPAFVDALDDLNARGVPFVLSYDGRLGEKSYGEPLPASLGLTHLEVCVGRSSQATLLGRDHETFESLYLSPGLSVAFDRRPRQIDDVGLFAALV